MKSSVTDGMKAVEEESLKPENEDFLAIELAKGVEMYFRKIKAGLFRMGSRGFDHDEEPVHAVNIKDDFYLGYFPVTLDQFLEWDKQYKNHFDDDGSLPVEQVTWDRAVEYCGWLNESGKVPEGFEAALPSEAHWEYACKTSPGTEAGRSDPGTEYSNGDGEAALTDVGWYGANSDAQTHPVGG